ncbi:TPA: helix-turn-helix domain-containing protein [Escherichia coli]|nr:helix-turn-helix domain-containing protein [Escherichia coli]
MGYIAMWAASSVIESRDDLDAKEAATLLAIAKYADDNGKCFPGRKTLMKLSKWGDRSTTAAIAGLVDKGLITSDERKDDKGRKSNMYTLLFPLKVEDTPSTRCDTPSQEMRYPLAPDAIPPSTRCEGNLLPNQSPNRSDIKTPTHDCAGDVGGDKVAAKERRQREKVAKAKRANEVIALYNEMASRTGLMPPAIYGDGKGSDYPAKIAKLGKEMKNGGTLEDWRNYLAQALNTASDFWIDRAIFDDLLKPETLRKVRDGRR